MAESGENIAIGSDHAGYSMKEHLKKILIRKGYKIQDFGTASAERIDYPDFIHPLAASIEKGLFSRGIVICGSGNGAAMVANKYPHVRAALCWNREIAYLARLHNDSNILSLPARFMSNRKAANLVKVFLQTEFEGGRHKKRVEKISEGIQS